MNDIQRARHNFFLLSGINPNERKRIKKMKKQNRVGNLNIKGWWNIRSRIMDRDNYCCKICGQDYDLHVHHIDYHRANNEDDNLVTLCQSCHKAVHEEGYKPFEHEDHPVPWGIL